MRNETEKPDNWTDAMSNDFQLVHLSDLSMYNQERFFYLNKMFIAAEKRAFEYDKTTNNSLTYMAGATYGIICAPLLKPMLTKRESEVLYLVRQGVKEKEIGKILGITRGGVSSNKSRSIDKMRVIMPNVYQNISALNNRYVRV